MTQCYHCGDNCTESIYEYDAKSFCCNGCKTVYEILQVNDLGKYYELNSTPGTAGIQKSQKFAYLDDEKIASKILEFDVGETQMVSLYVPNIHCSSCIWVLENLNKINKGISTSSVDFPKKILSITFSEEKISLRQVVELLSRLGYEPTISLDDVSDKKQASNKSLIIKLGIAGFAFGNIMFLSFPEYFDTGEFWLERFKYAFRWLILLFSLPVVTYCARDYFVAAYKGLRSGMLNIDLPIALGISTLFLRSVIDIIFDWGPGFLDSLTGLVFFLLVGKFFQQRTYAFLSFERDYKSYFPVAVTRIDKSESNKLTENQVAVYELLPGDRILIRNNELIPVDGKLIMGEGFIDYSFVTGESRAVTHLPGDEVFAGGKQLGNVLEIEVARKVEQSNLTRLWNKQNFNKGSASNIQSLIDLISRKFTATVLIIATVAAFAWIGMDSSKAFNVFTAVLIIACPCALALATPFTLGNLMRIFGRNKLYIKEAAVIERMGRIDTVVFDKTGTLTSGHDEICYEGVTLDKEETDLLSTSLRASNHPLSRGLYKMLKDNNILTLDEFEEAIGRGILAKSGGNVIKIGSMEFVDEDGKFGSNDPKSAMEPIARTAVHISTNDTYRGKFVFKNTYRLGMTEVFNDLHREMDLFILSGDNDSEQSRLQESLPVNTGYMFDQSPEDKLKFIERLQNEGRRVMMVGDGLNDAAALRQSDVGIAISDNINVFSPACDAILDASMFKKLTQFIALSRRGIRIIRWCIGLSFLYNLVGLYFAVTGQLEPVIAAILMPLSSISVVVFTTLITNKFGRHLRTEYETKQ